MQIQTFYPQHPVLKKYVEYYYFLKTDSPDFSNTYYAFPHIVQGVNIHKHAACEITPGFTNVFENRSNKYLTIVQGHFELPLLVSLRGRLDKVTIVFKTLGLQHFIKSSFKSIAADQSQIFTEWENSEYTGFLDNFYEVPDLNDRVILLEDFLMSRFQEFSEADMLTNILKMLSDLENDRSMNEIAAALSINTRKLNRLFDTHLGINPIAFKKIIRFRHSLKNKIFSSHFKTLTEIGYESNFYDQSYFVRIYKNLTGKNPSKFFSSIEKLADNQLIFEFINK